MNNSEDVKFIAECLGLTDVSIEKTVVYGFTIMIEGSRDVVEYGERVANRGRKQFNPYESWNDCGLVLEALVEEYRLQHTINVMAEFIKDGDLKTAICESYIRVKVMI